jgi:hemolysin III
MQELSWNYDRAETTADGVIHVLGVLLGISGAVTLAVISLGYADAGVAAAALIYALSLVVTLSMSAVYNMWPVSPRKWRLRKYDHAAIYLLIAGTYTPFALQMDARGVWLLMWTWSVAALGMFLKITFPNRFDRTSILLYLGLGWSGVVLFDQLVTSFSAPVVWLLAIGGAIYSIGVIFHLWQSLRFQNAIWHGFVLTGASLHYSAVVTSVARGI